MASLSSPRRGCRRQSLRVFVRASQAGSGSGSGPTGRQQQQQRVPTGRAQECVVCWLRVLPLGMGTTVGRSACVSLPFHGRQASGLARCATQLIDCGGVCESVSA
jgi:hypothetical protein